MIGNSDISHRVHCVLLDLDGTLYESEDYNEYFDSEMSRIVSERLGVSNEEASRILQTRRKEKGTLTRAIESLGIGRLEFHQLVAERLDPAAYLSSDQETLRLLRELRERGLRIGLVSNSGRGLVYKILDALGLDRKLFDVIVTGTDVEPKPSHQPFLLAMEKIGCAKVNTVYVGDRDEAEIRPAKEVGLRTVLISRSVNERGAAKWADIVVGDISELKKELLKIA